MESTPRLPRAVSEAKRERDIFHLYSSCFKDIPQLDPEARPTEANVAPNHHVARPAKDSALMAFAQLAAVRMGACRAIISLIDDKRQHILAEATPTTSVRFESQCQVPGDLWLGNVSIPRKWGVCEQVLTIDPSTIATNKDSAIIVIDDLAQSTEHAQRIYVTEWPRLLFYAGVALTSPGGAIVGALSIFDNNPRNGLSQDDIFYMQDLAATIGEYLDTYTLKEQFKRGEQLTRGLVSFVEGASSLQPFKDENQATSQLFPSIRPSAGGSKASSVVSGIASIDKRSAPSQELWLQTKPPPESLLTWSTQHGSIHALQHSILPADSKFMFARAANIIRTTSELDGVVILDASVAATGQHNHEEDADLESEDDSSAWSGYSRSSSEASNRSRSRSTKRHSKTSGSTKKCQILGFATPEKSGVAGDSGRSEHVFLEQDLTRLLRKFPNGKIIHFTKEGDVTSSASESEKSLGSSVTLVEDNRQTTHLERKQHSRSERSSNAIHTFAPQARSIVFIPFWDYERSRWFAGCFCWTNKPERLLSQLDLSYFKIFSNSIMNELARLDAISSNQAKTTFVASISHELRSPLHGILGTLQFMQDTPLDSFQITMLNSLAACGQTLLDTINHILDYAKINESRRNISSKRMTNSKTIRVSSKPVKSKRTSAAMLQDSAFDLAVATEEVVEAVFAGQSWEAISSNQEDGSFSPLAKSQGSDRRPSADTIRKRKDCFVVLDIQPEQDWVYALTAGSWKRIVMNIFGNALKFTNTGRIQIKLRVSERGSNESRLNYINLTVTDSGSGISSQFLANKLFQPFSQENPHAPGTGLGLSIVHQIIETVGGKVEVTSDVSSGTKVSVKLALNRPKDLSAENPTRSQFLDLLPRLQSRRICILSKPTTISQDQQDDLPHNHAGLASFSDSLSSTLTGWLKMEVVHTSEWDGNNTDLVICPEVSFDYLSTIRRRRPKFGKAPVTIFVAMDGLEAATLRQDVRITNKESVVEIMTQPCGPYKLAHLLNHCLNRYDSPDENLQPLRSATQSPHSIEGLIVSRPISPATISTDGAITSQRSVSPIHSEAHELEKEPESAIMELPSPVSSTTYPSGAITPLNATTTTEPIQPLTIQQRLNNSESHVLITDDNRINRKLLATFLGKRKIPYQEAENGLEALQKYQAGSVRFDAILMDISMPVLDGMSATRAIRDYEQKNNVKKTLIIAMTGLASSSAKLEAWSSGVDHFMTKPVSFKELESLLQDRSIQENEKRSRREERAAAKIDAVADSDDIHRRLAESIGD